MDKFTRNQRIAIIMKILTENPNKIINLNNFTEIFNAAKSTISEDLFVVKDILNRMSMGKVETISGAAGGVKFVNGVSEKKSKEFAEKLCINLSKKDRIIPGNFLYVTDIMCNPEIIKQAAKILSSFFSGEHIDYVITVETKGIPLAYEVANLLGVQLVVVRRENKLTEGSTLSINYVSGSSGRVQNMYVSKDAIKKNSNCIFIDDFMKAGGTALGIINLLKEFESKLLGIGVLIDNKDITKKLVDNYFSIIDFNGFDDNGNIVVKPSKLFR
ncbi:pur operon repressor [Clostridium tepidum]|jgi:purine operon repressor|uniref:Pur operon repressor n=1 Tax=Clostridium tepidum TaxID=1962263 RepID=A0A1S9IGV3_9CLOT|nr:pur operon repressor [Clostridium tepidum]MCR1934870.1 pur operon repressor [Clostridium tepidum]MDU6878775.1 pur operon repressor [Clostridium botulinum]OOO61878.1 pur operon repressor [Clostridium tepidum]OOO69498.1 pur operon repressor [Clostridium tepidum]